MFDYNLIMQNVKHKPSLICIFYPIDQLNSFDGNVLNVTRNTMFKVLNDNEINSSKYFVTICTYFVTRSTMFKVLNGNEIISSTYFVK